MTQKRRVRLRIVIQLLVFVMFSVLAMNSLRETSNLNYRVLNINKNTSTNNDLVQSIQETIEGVVHITNETQGLQGSGFAISKDMIGTARHVVKNGKRFKITMNNGDVVYATKAVSSKKYDLGYIKIDTQILKPLKLGSIKDCQLGQQVYAIGSSEGFEGFNNVTVGHISSLYRNLNWMNTISNNFGWSIAWQTDTATYGGNSGCPLFSIDGRVRGVLVGGIRNFESISYCIPSDLIIGELKLVKMLFAFDRYYIEDTTQEYENTQSWRQALINVVSNKPE